MARGRRWRFGGTAKITRGALYLLFATTGLSLVAMVAGTETKAQFLAWLSASGATTWGQLRVWQLVTSPFLEPDIVGLLFQGFALWMFLPALERWWGTKRFLMFALYTSVAGTLAGTLVGFLAGGTLSLHYVAGLDPFVFGGIVAYGILFSTQQVQFFGVLPMTGKQLTWGIIGFVALFILVGQLWVEGAAMVAAVILSWMMVSDRFAPRLWLLKAKQRRMRRHLSVVKDKDEPKRWMN